MPAGPSDAAFRAVRDRLEAGRRAAAFPAAVVEAGREAGPLWRSAVGTLTYDAGAPACRIDTVFDLASLTKVIATATVAMRLAERGALDLDAPVGRILASWRGVDRAAVRIRHLLDHSSGLPAYVPFWERLSGRAAIEAELVRLPLARQPGTVSEYSDPGFILLGFAIEAAGGAPLGDQFRAAAAAWGAGIGYGAPAGPPGGVAPTGIDPWRGRLLAGEVHDENAAALGGVAGHAGLFGSAPAVGAFARLVLRTFREPTALGSPPLMRAFATRSAAIGSRALGWDTMLPTSSCGTRFSRAAIGHTGFTGTSLWIDPALDLYVVLLTNRVHPTRANEALPALRPALHDAIVDAMMEA